MGCFVVFWGDRPIDVMNCLFFVVMAIISAIFDFTPVILLISAGLAWSIYSDCRNNGTYESEPFGRDPYDDPYRRPAYSQPQPASRPPARNDNPPRSGNSS